MSKYILFLGVVLLTACSGKKNPEQKKESKPEVVFEGSLFQTLYLGQLFESPNSFGPVWNLEACRKLKFEKVSMYVRAGQEKLTYTFDSQGNPMDFAHYVRVADGTFSRSHFTYNDGNLSKIDIYEYLDFSNLPPVFIQRDSARTIAITSRGDGKSDSTLFYPSIESPKVIVEIVNNFINSIEIFAQKGTNNEELKAIALAVDSNLVDFDLTEKMVTYMENGLPTESYHLDKSWNKLEKSRYWDYNAKKLPIKYKEWLHGTLIKDIEINYRSNNLPSDIIVDRKKYIFYNTFQ